MWVSKADSENEDWNREWTHSLTRPHESVSKADSENEDWNDRDSGFASDAPVSFQKQIQKMKIEIYPRYRLEYSDLPSVSKADSENEDWNPFNSS